MFFSKRLTRLTVMLERNIRPKMFFLTSVYCKRAYYGKISLHPPICQRRKTYEEVFACANYSQYWQLCFWLSQLLPPTRSKSVRSPRRHGKRGPPPRPAGQGRRGHRPQRLRPLHRGLPGVQSGQSRPHRNSSDKPERNGRRKGQSKAL